MAGRSREGLYAVEFANAPAGEGARVVEAWQTGSRRADGRRGQWWWVRRGVSREARDERGSVTRACLCLCSDYGTPRTARNNTATGNLGAANVGRRARRCAALSLGADAGDVVQVPSSNRARE